MQTRSRTALAGLVATALVIVPAMFAPATLGATPDTPYDTVVVDSPDGQATGRWGERIVMGSDIDGDGASDYFVGTPSHTVGGVENSGRVYLMS